MTIFLGRVLELLKSRGISKNKLLIDLGLGKNSFVNWANRNTIPGGDTLQRIANYFSVSVDYLLGKSDAAIDDSVLDIVNGIDQDILETAGTDLNIAIKWQSDRDRLSEQIETARAPLEAGMVNGDAERIRLAIARKKLSYSELERQTGIQKAVLQQYASGGTKRIPADDIEKIAAVTGTTAEYLMGEGAVPENPVTPGNYDLGGFLSAVNYAQDNGISPDELKRIIDLAIQMRGGMH